MERYFIDKKECTGFEILRLAFEAGWQGSNEDTRLAGSVSKSVAKAIAFLRLKGIQSIVVYAKGEEESKTESISEDVAMESPPVIDDSLMICLIEDSIYEVDTKLLGLECWDLQSFGVMGCKGCCFKNKRECNEGESFVDGKNSLGHEVPVAKKIGERPKRDNATMVGEV